MGKGSRRLENGGTTPSAFTTVSLDVEVVGRWLRLVYGDALVAALVIEAILEGGLLGDPFPANVASTAVYFLGIFVAYLLAHRLLADRLFARSDPWSTRSSSWVQALYGGQSVRCGIDLRGGRSFPPARRRKGGLW